VLHTTHFADNVNPHFGVLSSIQAANVSRHG